MDLARLTREIFGNVSPLSQWVFYALGAAALVVFLRGIRRRWLLWQIGRRTQSLRPRLAVALRRVFNGVYGRSPVAGRGTATVAHALLLTGFLVLFLGTVLVGFEHVLAMILARPPTQPVFHAGIYYAAYEVVTDLFGICFLTGAVLLIARRVRGGTSVDPDPRILWLLILLVGIGVTGYVVEGLRILHARTPTPGFSFAGLATAELMRSIGLGGSASGPAHIVVWWLHAFLALGLIAVAPYTRLLHVVAGVVSLGGEEHRLGQLSLVTLEQFEAEGDIGAGNVKMLDRRQLVELDACVSCGRCHDVCPAADAGRPLSPRHVVQSLRVEMEAAGRGTRASDTAAPLLAGTAVSEAAAWSCTSCSACVAACPLGVDPLGMIIDVRRNLVGNGRLHGPAAMTLTRLQRSGDPWGFGQSERLKWAAGMNVPTVKDTSDYDVLYWIGCAAAFDQRLQNIARSMVRLLQAAGVKFAVLGAGERCTGDSARRLGDEFLFQELAQANLEQLARCGAADGKKTVVTHCPHCLNAFLNDYPQLGARINAVHHSEFLAGLVRSGRLPLSGTPAEASASIVYHDPCYLARVAGVTEAPRELLDLVQPEAARKEMPRNRRSTACCGAGGGMMWFDDRPQDRIGRSRIEETVATGAQTLAVGCPFCCTMMSDGLNARSSTVVVRDIAEILSDQIAPAATPAPGECP